jgi:hypothetical protein
MAFGKRNRGLVVMVTAAALCGFGSINAACAGDDGQSPIWMGIGGMLGLTEDKIDDPIKYGERPRLVLPPSSGLPSPIAAEGQKTADWPQDPDVLRVQKEREAKQHWHVPLVGQSMVDAKPVSPNLLRSDHAAPGTDSTSNHCHGQNNSRECNWIRPDILAAMGLKKDDNTIVAGQEPDREWLTDPPKGYRLPTKSVKATFEGVQHNVMPGDPRTELYKAPAQ